MNKREQDFITMLKENQDDFYRLAFSYLKNKEDALEIIGEATYKGLKNLKKLREPKYMKTWFYRILINESKKALRKKKQIIYDSDYIEMLTQPEHHDYIDLYNAIDQLNQNSKDIIKLRYFKNLKLEEISQVIGCNLNTTKSRLRRATLKLETLIGENYNG